MVRASTSGMIDFRQCDPWDNWWWKRLRWVLDELEMTLLRDVSKTQHNHWITLASHGNLTDESFDAVKTNAKTALNRYLKAMYPWLADQIGEEGTQTDRENAVKSYEEEFGKPGDPHYEAMVDTLTTWFKKTQSPLDIDRERRERRKRREEAERAAQRSAVGA